MSAVPEPPLRATRRAALAAAAVLLTSRTGRAAQADRPAGHPAAAFVDSVGVCTHLVGEPYRSNFARFRALLAESGIRHLREQLETTNDIGRWRDLAAGLGVRFNLLVSPYTNTVPQLFDYLKAVGPGVVSAVEGQNEANSDWFKKLPLTGGDWAGTTIAYQRSLYEAVRRRYSAEELPVLSSSLIDFRPRDAALLREAAPFCDIVSLHPYVQHAQEPETAESYAALPWYIQNFRDGFKPGAPAMATEMGYTNVVSPNGGGISELASSIYLPRALLNNFAAGLLRTFFYEFMDSGVEPANTEHHYGLVRFDGTPKPAFRTISALLKALDDRGTGTGAAAGSQVRTVLRASFPDAPPDLRHQAFVRRDGVTVMAVWRPVRAWDVAAGRDLDIVPAPVSMAVERRDVAVQWMALDGGASWTDAPPGTTVALPVGGRVTLVRLTARHA